MFWFGYSISFRHRDRERERMSIYPYFEKKWSGKHPYKCQNVSKLSRVQQTLFTKHSRKLLKLSTALQINSHITLTHILPCQEKERQRQRDRETETERHRERQREKQTETETETVWEKHSYAVKSIRMRTECNWVLFLHDNVQMKQWTVNQLELDTGYRL